MEKSYIQIITEFFSVFVFLFSLFVILKIIYYFSGQIQQFEKNQSIFNKQQIIIEQQKYENLYKMYLEIEKIIQNYINQLNLDFEMQKTVKENKMKVLIEQKNLVTQIKNQGNQIVPSFSNFYFNQKNFMIPQNRFIYNEYLNVYFKINNNLNTILKDNQESSLVLNQQNVNYFINLNSQLQKINTLQNVVQVSQTQFNQLKNPSLSLDIQIKISNFIRGEILQDFQDINSQFSQVNNVIIQIKQDIQNQVNNFNFVTQINETQIGQNKKQINQIQINISEIQEKANVNIGYIQKIFQIEVLELFFVNQIDLLRRRFNKNYFIYSEKKAISSLIDSFTQLNSLVFNAINKYKNSNLSKNIIDETYLFFIEKQKDFQSIYNSFLEEVKNNQSQILKRKQTIDLIVQQIQKYSIIYKQFSQSQQKGFFVYQDNKKYSKIAAFAVFQQILQDFVSLFFSYVQNINLNNEEDCKLQIENILNIKSGNLQKTPYIFKDDYFVSLKYFN